MISHQTCSADENQNQIWICKRRSFRLYIQVHFHSGYHLMCWITIQLVLQSAAILCLLWLSLTASFSTFFCRCHISVIFTRTLHSAAFISAMFILTVMAVNSNKCARVLWLLQKAPILLWLLRQLIEVLMWHHLLLLVKQSMNDTRM